MSSVWSNVVSVLLNAFAPASNPLTSAASATVIAKITGDSISIGELSKGLAGLSSFPWIRAEGAIESKLSDVQDDAVTLEAVAAVLADLGVPLAGDVGLLIKVAAFLIQAAPKADVGGAIGYVKPTTVGR